jgi:hypothetical protein
LGLFARPSSGARAFGTRAKTETEPEASVYWRAFQIRRPRTSRIPSHAVQVGDEASVFLTPRRLVGQAQQKRRVNGDVAGVRAEPGGTPRLHH